MTIDEAAEHLGITRRTLQRRIATGALPVFRDGAIVRVSSADLRRYVAVRTARELTATRRPGPPEHLPRRLWD